MCFRPSPARRDTHFILTFCGAFAAVSILRPLLSTLPLLPPLPSVGVSTPFPSFHLTASRTKPIQGRASHWGLVQCAVSSISRLQYHTPPPAFSPAKLKKPFSLRETKIFIFPVLNHLSFFTPNMRIPLCYFQIGKRSCAPLARPQQFLSWPGYVACSVVLTSRKPFKSFTVVPLRGGDRREDLPFERINASGCSDSAYRRPTGYRG